MSSSWQHRSKTCENSQSLRPTQREGLTSSAHRHVLAGLNNDFFNSIGWKRTWLIMPVLPASCLMIALMSAA